MYIRRSFLWVIFILASYSYGLTQTKHELTLKTLPSEKWWGCMSALGARMPFEGNLRLYDMAKENTGNQNTPLMVSSAGRYIWSDHPFAFQVEEGTITLYSEYEPLQVIQAGKTLKEGYLAAARKHFPPSGDLPDPLFFSMPQYNTWIELMYNQNQKDILEYADKLLEHDFPVGVFMIDDGWQKNFGDWNFKPENFPDPKRMMEHLHTQGFKVMLWVCPFISPDSPQLRALSPKGYVVKQKGANHPAIIPWWNGYSASYDLSNPEAVAHLRNELYRLQQKYKVDGFKFDAGDIGHYSNPDLEYYDKSVTAIDISKQWNLLGLEFPFNEFRAGWNMGGQAIVQRLKDKFCSWHDLQLLIPEILSLGLMSYPYTCPDMIGGGEYRSFLDMDPGSVDQELIVRSCQVHALMPMMQFSVAPWRILSEENLAICRRYARLHESMGPYILELARHASETSEPIIRCMEYAFPHEGLSECKDQFMLGDKYLVAPMLKPGTSRTVILPKGNWKDETGKRYRGGKAIEIQVPLERLPYFEKL